VTAGIAESLGVTGWTSIRIGNAGGVDPVILDRAMKVANKRRIVF